jgi:hypothetical protein
MRAYSSFLVRLAVLLLLPLAAGCCCSCQGFSNLPAMVGQGSAKPTGEVAPGPPEGSDPDLVQGWAYAQQALTNKGLGAVQTATLQKDGTRWYVSGTVKKVDGAVVPFDVQFGVTRFDNTQSWDVQAVKVDEVVVFP